ncbi:MAG TPA: PilZ domain-containing protein [Myxococcota bacterium]|nr:PilZ domain-containing protein [Myxococcota bacterium]
MDVASWIARNADRVRVEGKAVFRQGETSGSWTVVDLSERGLCARGSLKNLDTATAVEVRVQVGRTAFIAQVQRRWARETPSGMAHGWEVLSVREASQRKLRRMVEPAPERGIHSRRFGTLLGVA